MEFTSVALRRSIKDSDEELSVSFTEAYGTTLKPFHGMLVRPVFSVCSVIFILSIMHTYIHIFIYFFLFSFFFFGSIKLAMKAVPYRKEFFQKLGDDQDKVEEQYKAWLLSFEKVVERLNNFYVEGGYDKGKF